MQKRQHASGASSLFAFVHGLGPCLLARPALRAKSHGTTSCARQDDRVVKGGQRTNAHLLQHSYVELLVKQATGAKRSRAAADRIEELSLTESWRLYRISIGRK